MTNIWFTSDHHFHHQNVIKLCNRPFESLEEMHEEMIKKWNKYIKPEDTVYHLGDLSFGKNKDLYEIAQQLNGKNKILIRGNHDKLTDEAYKNAGFLIFEKVVLKLNKNIRVNICHYPYRPTKQEEAENLMKGIVIRFLDNRFEDDHNWLIHGHVHGIWKVKNKQINVSVDAWNFKPVSINEIFSIINKSNSVT